jgi:peptidoglycan hydrolase-like protein with peptidoglycan-binding domain
LENDLDHPANASLKAARAPQMLLPGDHNELLVRLTNLDYNPGPVDGILGPKTTAAIEDFCAQNEIDSPDQGEIRQQFCDTLTQAHGFSLHLQI